MAETINLTKRLIGKEDIDFDVTGTGEQDHFYAPDGEQKLLSKLNASHIPLTAETRSHLSSTNIDEALLKVSKKVDDFTGADVLEEDTVVEFTAEDDTETIQNTINSQKKNLNGHTLTFNFPANVSQNLYTTISFDGFFNGIVVIAGGREESRIAVYDQLDITSLFRITRCQCEVIVKYFHFVHLYSPYGAVIESASSVKFEYCVFSGSGDNVTYAVSKENSNVGFFECETVDDINIFSVNNTELEQHNTSADAHENRFTEVETAIGELDTAIGELDTEMQTYLPLTGGTVTGDVTVDGVIHTNDGRIMSDDDILLQHTTGNNSNRTCLYSGDAYNTGSYLFLFGMDHPDSPGKFLLRAQGTSGTSFEGFYDGTLKWAGMNVAAINTWQSGPNWYRKYNDGWVEQGGTVSTSKADTWTAVSLHVAMTNTTYFAMASNAGDSSEVHSAKMAGTSKNTTTKVYVATSVGGSGARWYVCGRWK